MSDFNVKDLASLEVYSQKQDSTFTYLQTATNTSNLEIPISIEEPVYVLAKGSEKRGQMGFTVKAYQNDTLGFDTIIIIILASIVALIILGCTIGYWVKKRKAKQNKLNYSKLGVNNTQESNYLESDDSYEVSVTKLREGKALSRKFND